MHGNLVLVICTVILGRHRNEVKENLFRVSRRVKVLCYQDQIDAMVLPLTLAVKSLYNWYAGSEI